MIPVKGEEKEKKVGTLGERNLLFFHFVSSFASSVLVRHGASTVPMHQGAYLLLLCALLMIFMGCVVWLAVCSRVPGVGFCRVRD